MLSYADRINQLKQRILKMVLAREGYADSAEASPIWREVTGVLGYVMELSAEALRNIRFHVGLINGLEMKYWHPYPRIDDEAEARNLGYVRMIQGLPDRYWVSEPPTPGIPRPLGVSYKGRIVNHNVTRFQNCVSVLYHAGAMRYVEQAKKRQIVLEVGAGYGGLAHCLSAMFEGKVTYVIIDLPEILFISGVFLLVNNPTKSVWIYDAAEAAGSGLVEKILAHDFVLLPDFLVERLSELENIAIIINLQSFQEMTEEQVTKYLDLGVRKLSFCLYSDNIDLHPHNQNLSSVSRLLAERFILDPGPAWFQDVFKGIDLQSYLAYQKYVAQPRGAVIKASPIPEHLLRPQGLKMAKLRARVAPVERFLRGLLG